jgi:Flp pilus assembly CpaF family ATPase
MAPERVLVRRAEEARARSAFGSAVTQRVPYRAIAQAINLVVFIERTADGRMVREVSRLVGREGDAYVLKPVLASGE